VTGAYPVLHVGSFGPSDRVRPARPWARTFRGMPASVPEARRFVAELLAGCPAREALMTCVSELCANAIAHTASGNGGVFTVEVDIPRPGVARIAVTDEGGPSLPTAARLDRMAGPLNAMAGPLDPTAGSLDPMTGSLDPMTGSLDPMTGSLDPMTGSLDPMTRSLDPMTGRLDLMAEGGRGLAMVAACTSRWGYADAYPGRTVWAEACWPVPVPAEGRDGNRTSSGRSRPRLCPDPPTDWPSGPAA
jgi:Histidine kinase-like ATPase domain